MNLLGKLFLKAKKEGRICKRCGWMVTKESWKKGYRLCAGCASGLRGVDTFNGHYQPAQDAPKKFDIFD